MTEVAAEHLRYLDDAERRNIRFKAREEVYKVFAALVASLGGKVTIPRRFLLNDYYDMIVERNEESGDITYQIDNSRKEYGRILGEIMRENPHADPVLVNSIMRKFLDRG